MSEKPLGYADAYASARKNCKHENRTNVLYQREWFCEDCERVLHRSDLKRNMWGFYD